MDYSSYRGIYCYKKYLKLLDRIEGSNDPEAVSEALPLLKKSIHSTKNLVPLIEVMSAKPNDYLTFSISRQGVALTSKKYDYLNNILLNDVLGHIGSFCPDRMPYDEVATINISGGFIKSFDCNLLRLKRGFNKIICYHPITSISIQDKMPNNHKEKRDWLVNNFAPTEGELKEIKGISECNELEIRYRLSDYIVNKYRKATRKEYRE